MKLGVMSPVLGGMSLRQMIEYLSSLGVQSLELGCGGYPGKAHPHYTRIGKKVNRLSTKILCFRKKCAIMGINKQKRSE